jgi:hypothetical protein
MLKMESYRFWSVPAVRPEHFKDRNVVTVDATDRRSWGVDLGLKVEGLHRVWSYHRIVQLGLRGTLLLPLWLVRSRRAAPPFFWLGRDGKRDWSTHKECRRFPSSLRLHSTPGKRDWTVHCPGRAAKLNQYKYSHTVFFSIMSHTVFVHL